MDVIQTTGDRGLDEVLDRFQRRLDLLESIVTGVQTVPQRVDPPIDFGSGLVTVQEVDGDPSITADLVEFDQSDGFQVSASASGNGARIDRLATAVTPTAQSVASTAGTNTDAANSDHAHAPVVTTKGDILGYSTLPVRVPVGTNGKVATADSTKAAGWDWESLPAGGGSVDLDFRTTVTTGVRVLFVQNNAATYTLPAASGTAAVILQTSHNVAISPAGGDSISGGNPSPTANQTIILISDLTNTWYQSNGI